MRLVFVHGINSQDYSAADIESSWSNALYSAWVSLKLPHPPDFSVSIAYYATRLAELATSSSTSIAAGSNIQSNTVEIGLLREYLTYLGITDAQVIAAGKEAGLDCQVTTAGPPHEPWCIAAACALEKVLPSSGKYIASLFVPQTAVYIERAGVRDIIRPMVEAVLLDGDGPDIVISHSMGTVISYEILANNPQRNVPLFVTLGSPLAVRIIRDHVGVGHKFPDPPIQQWINGVDRSDFVTLGRSLDRSVLGFDGIQNIDVVSSEENKHSIFAYLSAPAIATAIHEALVSS